MDRVIEALQAQELPDNPVYLTLDIIVEYAIQTNGQFPTYRTIGLILGKLLKKENSVSTATVQRYLFELEDNKRIERNGHSWKLRNGRFVYYDAT